MKKFIHDLAALATAVDVMLLCHLITCLFPYLHFCSRYQFFWNFLMSCLAHFWRPPRSPHSLRTTGLRYCTVHMVDFLRLFTSSPSDPSSPSFFGIILLFRSAGRTILLQLWHSSTSCALVLLHDSNFLRVSYSSHSNGWGSNTTCFICGISDQITVVW